MNRKEAIRNYKETPRPMGVYCIRNNGTRRALVGSSVDVTSMLNRARFQLEHGSHPNRQLQRDWNELGAGAFSFETLDTLKPAEQPGYDPAADLETLEAMWRETVSKSGELY